MVRSKIENAHGLILSISAANETNGKSLVPPDDKFQMNTVAPLEDFRNSKAASTTSANVVNNMNFLCFIHYGVTWALISNTSFLPSVVSTKTLREIGPTPAGPWAAGSNTTSICAS